MASKIGPLVLEESGKIDKAKVDAGHMLMKKFVEKLGKDIDLNPPYQRGACWTAPMQQRLIKTVLQGSMMPPVYLAKKPNLDHKKNVVDGKQRSTALLNFYTGNLKVPIMINGEESLYSFPDIVKMVEMGHDVFKTLIDAFEDYEVPVITYENLNIEGQCDLFSDINTFMEIEPQEVLLGQHFFAKELYSLIWAKCLGRLLPHIKIKNIRDNKRDVGAIYVARLCFICFGADFQQPWGVRDLEVARKGQKLTYPALSQGIISLHKFLADFISKSQHASLSEEAAKELQFWPKIDLLRKCCNAVADILEFNNTASKKMSHNDLLDVVAFFMKKIEEKVLTVSMLQAHKELYLNLIFKALETKSKDEKVLSSKTCNPPQIKRRIDIFEATWEAMVEDKGIKKQKISDTDVSLALLASGSRCPLTGEALTDRNIQVDHVKPASLYSATTYQATSAYGNRLKSNINPDLAQNIKDCF